VVGLGPGSPLDRTRRCEQAIAAAELVVGYRPYVDSLADLTAGKELAASGMRQEVQRCRLAVLRAAAGQTVALVSSGDAGVYGMAGLALEVARGEGLLGRLAIEIVPGVTAATSAAARLGAPLMTDFAAISLSDLLVEWSVIRRRLEAAAAADLVTVLYNPRSVKRQSQLAEAAAIFLRHRPASTPAGVATALGAGDERVVLCDLASLLEQEVTMRSVVVIGNTTTRVLDGWMVTARGYRL